MAVGKEYIVHRDPCGGVRVLVSDRFAGYRFLLPETSQRHRMFSESFQMGDLSGGAKQLAMAILLEELRDPRQAENLCRGFADDFTSKWAKGYVVIHSKDIQEWVSNRKVAVFV